MQEWEYMMLVIKDVGNDRKQEAIIYDKNGAQCIDIKTTTSDKTIWPNVIQALNKAGALGWELTGDHPYNLRDRNEYWQYLVFKKPV